MPKKQKIDGVIVGVHYLENGQVDWVRAFLRRGAVFSDRTRLSRSELIAELKSGKSFVSGSRVEYMASTFEKMQVVSLFQNGDFEFLVNQQTAATADSSTINSDSLAEVPIL